MTPDTPGEETRRDDGATRPLLRGVAGVAAALTGVAGLLYLLMLQVVSEGVSYRPAVNYRLGGWVALAALGAVTATWGLVQAARGRRRTTPQIGLIAVGLVAGATGLPAIPAVYARAGDKPDVVAMRSHLRNVADALQAYHDAHQRYPSAVNELSGTWTPSTGVTIAFSAEGQGLQVTARHERLPGTLCALQLDTSAARTGRARQLECNW